MIKSEKEKEDRKRPYFETRDTREECKGEEEANEQGTSREGTRGRARGGGPEGGAAHGHSLGPRHGVHAQQPVGAAAEHGRRGLRAARRV